MTWLFRPLWGAPRWAWLGGVALALAAWGALGGGQGLLAGVVPLVVLIGRGLLGGRRPADPDAVEVEPAEAAHDDAVRVSRQAEERAVTLRAEERAAGASIEDAARRAAEDPLDEVDARIRREAGERRR